MGRGIACLYFKPFKPVIIDYQKPDSDIWLLKRSHAFYHVKSFCNGIQNAEEEWEVAENLCLEGSCSTLSGVLQLEYFAIRHRYIVL